MLGRASSCDQARETHRRSTGANYDHGGCEGDAGNDGTQVLAHVYLLEVVNDPMEHMMAIAGRRDCQPVDTWTLGLALVFFSFSAPAAEIKAEGANVHVDFQSTDF